MAADTWQSRGGEPVADGERKREALTYWLYRAAERVIATLPRALSMPAAAAVGNLAYDLAGPKRGVVHDNLAHPMGLDPGDPRVKAAARRAFRNYAKYLVDMMRIGDLSTEEAAALVSIDDVGVLTRPGAGGTAGLLRTLHVGGTHPTRPAVQLTGSARPLA